MTARNCVENDFYFEVCISLDSSEFSEIFTSEIMDFSGEAVEILGNQIIIRTSKDRDFIDALLAHLSDFSANLAQISGKIINFTHTIEKKQNRDWIEEYKKSVKPIRCGRFYICPPWCEGNLSLDKHSADLGFFGVSQTQSLVSTPKNSKNYESNTANTSIVIRNANQSAKNPSLRGESQIRAKQSKTPPSIADDKQKNFPLPCGGGLRGWVNPQKNNAKFSNNKSTRPLTPSAREGEQDSLLQSKSRNDENIANSKIISDSAEVSLDNFVGFLPSNPLGQARNCEIELEVHRAVKCAESSDCAKKTNAQTINIILEPSLAFGTGHHASTFMCIQALQSLGTNGGLQNKTLLDFGCGSGILALCAYKLGGQVDLCDIDELAIAESKKNFRNNNATISHIWQGEIRRESKGDTQDLDCFDLQNEFRNDGVVADSRKLRPKYDIIVANIIASVLIEQKENIASALKCGGIAILSGILNIYKDEVLAQFSDFLPLKIMQKDEWICLVLGKT